ncbi:ras-related protein Rab-8A isoform 2-T2 [Megaptera novaeangliae]
MRSLSPEAPRSNSLGTESGRREPTQSTLENTLAQPHHRATPRAEPISPAGLSGLGDIEVKEEGYPVTHASADVEKMILGNKCDVNDKRQVSKERGEKLALDYGIKFMETSAKANINVENAFFTLARDIKAKMDKKLEGNSPQGSNQGVKITPDQQKRSSFFRCVLL